MRRLVIGAVVALIASGPAAADSRRCGAEQAQVKDAIIRVHATRHVVGADHHGLAELVRRLGFQRAWLVSLHGSILHLEFVEARVMRSLAPRCHGPGGAARAACVEKRRHVELLERGVAYRVGLVGVTEGRIVVLEVGVASGSVRLAGHRAELADGLVAVRDAGGALAACKAG